MTKAKIKTHSSHNENSTLTQAFDKITGFRELYQKMERNMSLAGKSGSTLLNYGRHLAKLALHFDCLPTELDPDQIDDYLYLMKQQHKTPSDSYFKFTVYGLRYVMHMEGLRDKRIALLRGQKRATR